MSKLLFLPGIVFLALVALPIVLVAWLGWPGLALYFLLLVVFAFIVKRVAVNLFQRAFLAPFMAKSAVLKNAAVRLHSVIPAPTPEKPDEYFKTANADDWQEIEGAGDSQFNEYETHHFYYVDATISPAPPEGNAFPLWEPGELMLAPANAQKIVPNSDSDSELGLVQDVKIWNNGGWAVDEEGKYSGPVRVRLHVGVPPGTNAARLRYYFEVFGEIDFTSASHHDDFAGMR